MTVVMPRANQIMAEGRARPAPAPCQPGCKRPCPADGRVLSASDAREPAPSGRALDVADGAAVSPRPTCYLDALSDDVFLTLFVSTPFASHHALRSVCRRANHLLQTKEFRKLRLKVGCAEHGVIVAGGKTSAPTADCWLLASSRWRPIAPLGAPRSRACSAVLRGEMWLIGGNDGERVLGTVEVYNPREDAWRVVAPLREPREGAVAAVMGSSIVVAGGRGPDGHLMSVETYCPVADAWAPLPPLAHGAYFAAACALGAGRASRLYVAGGLESKRKLQVFDGKAWRLRADMPANRFGAAGVAHDGGFVVLGGFEGVHERASSAVMVYDPRADAWATSTRLPTPRAWCRAASHAGRIVSIGDGVLGDGMMLEYCSDATRAQPGPPGGGATRSELASIFLG